MRARGGDVCYTTAVAAGPDESAASLSFRCAAPGDAAAIVALVESAYRGESSRLGWTHESELLGGTRTSLADVAQRIAGAGSVMLVVEREGALLACCHLRQHGAICHFGMFAVAPRLQRAGTGRALLAEAERFARAEWRCDVVEMRVIDAREELLAWYLRRGYARTGVYEPIPEGPALLPKQSGLRFEVLRKSLG